jgi:hypothetical protein
MIRTTPRVIVWGCKWPLPAIGVPKRHCVELLAVAQTPSSVHKPLRLCDCLQPATRRAHPGTNEVIMARQISRCAIGKPHRSREDEFAVR